MQKHVNLVDLIKSFPSSNDYLLAKFGFDTAENEPCKVCPVSAYRSPRCISVELFNVVKLFLKGLHSDQTGHWISRCVVSAPTGV